MINQPIQIKGERSIEAKQCTKTGLNFISSFRIDNACSISSKDIKFSDLWSGRTKVLCLKIFSISLIRGESVSEHKQNIEFITLTFSLFKSFLGQRVTPLISVFILFKLIE